MQAARGPGGTGRSEKLAPVSDPVPTVFTDGACSGNPGPGGWAWAEPGGAFASGFEARTTNQRMELAAALDAVRTHPGRLRVVSDSTYVVNCFQKRWYMGWLERGWTNSQKKPVANRDLWEPLVDAYLGREGGPAAVDFAWVKGHSGDHMNDLVDRLAVEAAVTQRGRTGTEPPTDLGPPDEIRRAGAKGSAGADGRVPDGHKLVVLGHRPPELGGYEPNPVSGDVQRRLAEVLAAKRQLHPDLVVLTGLRLGAEQLAAEAARDVGVPYVAVLPYPDAHTVWPAASQARFAELLAHADGSVTLERKVPADRAAAGQALSRRDGWLAKHADEAVLVWDRDDRILGALHRKLEAALGDDVWIIEP